LRQRRYDDIDLFMDGGVIHLLIRGEDERIQTICGHKLEPLFEKLYARKVKKLWSIPGALPNGDGTLITSILTG
jgi:hypothetical protein